MVLPKWQRVMVQGPLCSFAHSPEINLTQLGGVGANVTYDTGINLRF